MSRISRRGLLQAMGLGAGASLLAPFLRTAWADGGAPRRFVFVVEGNGIHAPAFLTAPVRSEIEAKGSPLGTERVIYRKYGHSAPIVVPNAGLADAPALGSLAAQSSSELSLVNRAAVVLGLSSKVVGGGHSGGNGALASARGRSSPAAPTIDAVLANLVRGTTPFDAVRLGVGSNPSSRLNYATCAFAAKKAAPMITSTHAAYQLLFGTVLPGGGDSTKNQELLSVAKDDIARAQATFNSSSAERLKLDRYLEAVEALQQRHTRLVNLGGSLAGLVPAAPDVNPLYTDAAQADAMPRLEAQFELATAALLGSLTNVVVLGSGTGHDFNYTSPSLGGADEKRHYIQHGLGIPANATAALGCTRRHVELISRLARKLASVPEQGGTMLDNTVIVYMSDNGEQHHSTASEWPMLLVGGSALGFKTNGGTVVYPGVGNANNRQVSNLFNSLGHAAGDASMNEFGLEGSLRVAPGPLTEIYS